MSRFRKATRTMLVGQLFNWTGLGLSLVSVPLYLAWLGSERYGLLLTALACAGYLMFSDAGLSWSSMLLISHADGRGDQNEIALIVRTSLTLAMISALLAGIVAASAWVVLRQTGFSFGHMRAVNAAEASGLSLAVGAQVAVCLLLSAFYNLFIGLQDGHLAVFYQGMGRTLGVLASLGAASMKLSLGWVLGVSVLCTALAGGFAAFHAMARYPWAFQSGAWWDREQIRRQYRTGAKSFGLQIGRVMSSSAPVFALSSQAGAAAVPALTVACTLLNAPLSVFAHLNTNLQVAYGQAAGQGDQAWISRTLQVMLRQMLLISGLLTAGFVTLATPVVLLWTHGRLTLSASMIVSALMICLCTAFMSALQFALSGLNRHRSLAMAELVNGVLCLILAPLTVRLFGAGAVGVAILAAALASNARVATQEIKRFLALEAVWPPARFLAGVFCATLAAAGVGLACRLALESDGAAMAWKAWLNLFGVGLMVTLLYFLLARWLLPSETKQILALLDRWNWRSRRLASPADVS